MWGWLAAWVGGSSSDVEGVDLEAHCETEVGLPTDAGAELFSRVWTEGDPRSVAGDGVGPIYNERSCTACHNQGGAGGAGGSHADVRLEIVGGQTRVVHRVGERPAGLRIESRSLAMLSTRRMFFGEPRTPTRNTPALWGAGLIDAVSDAEIEAIAAAGDRDHPEITGRVARDADGKVARFGWKGQTRSLSAFVEAACANELGLETSAAHQPGDAAPGIDINDAQLSSLVSFVASLPAPEQIQTPGVEYGRQRFEDVGCGSCHRRQVGDVDGLYADLLLHDMGSELEDASSGYFGVSVAKPAHEGAADAREWRTPPLWGLSESAPYLHDGRARSIQEAILAHGGEAALVIRAYRSLPESDWAAIDTFLASLVSPRPLSGS